MWLHQIPMELGGPGQISLGSVGLIKIPAGVRD